MRFSASRYFFAAEHSTSYPNLHSLYLRGWRYFDWQIWGRWVINPGWRSDAAHLQIHIRIYYWQISVFPIERESPLSPHSEKIPTTVALNSPPVRICGRVTECAACSIFQFFIGFTTPHLWSAVIDPTDTHSQAIRPCSICLSHQPKNKLPELYLPCVTELPHPACYFSTYRINTSVLSGKPEPGCLFLHL